MPWSAVVDAVNDDAQFATKATQLEAVSVELIEDGASTFIELHRGRATVLAGRPLRGPVLQISGSTDGWRPLLAGEIPYVRSIHFEHGTLTLRGDSLIATWSTPALSRLFVIASQMGDTASQMGNTASQMGNTASELEGFVATAPAAVSGHYVLVRGVVAYYEDCGSGPPVLLLHTAGRDNRQWHGVMSELAASHRLIAPDLPGHGKSYPKPGNTCIEETDELIDWLIEFMEVVSPGRFAVMGCSIGGNLALLLAARCRDVVASVPIQASDLTSFPEASMQMLVDPRNNPMHGAMDFAMSLVGPRALPAGRAMIEWSVMTINGFAQRGDLKAYSTFDVRDEMANVTCPVLLVWGDADWVVTESMVRDAFGRLSGSTHAELLVLEGLGHYPHVEDPGRLAEAVRAVLTWP